MVSRTLSKGLVVLALASQVAFGALDEANLNKGVKVVAPTIKEVAEKYYGISREACVRAGQAIAVKTAPARQAVAAKAVSARNIVTEKAASATQFFAGKIAPVRQLVTEKVSAGYVVARKAAGNVADGVINAGMTIHGGVAYHWANHRDACIVGLTLTGVAVVYAASNYRKACKAQRQLEELKKQGYVA